MAAVTKPKSEMTSDELDEREAVEFKAGPLYRLTQFVNNNSQVIIHCKNEKKLLCRIKAVDRHWNMVLENVKEMWTGLAAKPAVNKERFISKMFLRGDSVMLVVGIPLATAAGK